MHLKLCGLEDLVLGLPGDCAEQLFKCLINTMTEVIKITWALVTIMYVQPFEAVILLQCWHWHDPHLHLS